MENISTKFKNIYNKCSTDSFLKKEALGGRIPFFISAYDPKQELEVRKAISLLKNKLESVGISVLEINLFDLSCELLELHYGVEKMFKVEKKKNKEKFLRALQSTLNIHERLMPEIKNKIDNSQAKIYFLTGIGLVFPFIRSHNILNNIQKIATESPTITFFPGKYDGKQLDLFGLLKDDNYYRAFNMDTIEGIK